MATSIVEGFSLSHAQILDGLTSFLAASLGSGTTAEDSDVYGVNQGTLNPNTDEWNNEGDDATLSVWSWLNYAEVAVQAGYLSFPLIAKLTGQTIAAGAAVGAINEIQTLTNAGATAGTFTLTFAGQTTTAIAFGATAAAVQTALLALSNVDDTDVVVTGGAGGPYTVTFGGKYAGTNVSQITIDRTALTGGTSTAATTTQGARSTSDSFALDLWHEDSMNVAPKPMILKMPSKDNQGAVRTLTIGLYKVNFLPITFDGPEYKSGLKTNYNGRALMSNVDEQGVAFADGKKRVGRLISHG